MENRTITRIVAAVLIAVATLIPRGASAYDFKEGGIYYNVVNGEAEVTYCVANNASYSGDVVIPETVTHGGVTYPVTAIGKSAFDWCDVLTSVTLPNSIDSIANFAFQRCSSLHSVVIPNSVKWLGNCVFWRSGLEKIVIGNSIEVIGEYCFQYCYGLKEVVLGSSVRYLEIKAFFDCPSLKSVTCLATTPPNMYAYYSFCDEAYRNATLKVNGASLDAYKTDANWGRFRSFENLTPAQQLTLDKAIMNLHVHANEKLTATVLPEEASQDLVWTSRNPEVATVGTNGWVTGVSVGETVVTAATTDGSNLEASCVVRILPNGVMTANQLTMPGKVTVEKGKPFELPVAMVNNDDITAVQFDLALPEGMELESQDGNYLIDLDEERATAAHELHARELQPGVIRVVISSPQSAPFNGSEGNLFTLHLNSSTDINDGDYNVMLTGVVLADADAVTYYAPNVATTVNVKSYVRGDANGDGLVNVGDYVTTANYILGIDPMPFIFSAADVDESGTIDVGDLVGIANLVLGDTDVPANAPHHDNDVILSGESITTADGHVIVTLNMANDVALTAWQMDVDVPEGMKIASANLSSRASHHSLSMNELNDGSVRLLGASSINDVVTGNEGALLTLVLEGATSDQSTLTVSDAVLAEADMTTHGVSPFNVHIGNSAVKEVFNDVKIYAQGNDIVVEAPAQTTVELISLNGMTQTMKAQAGINTYRVESGIYIVRVLGNAVKVKI